ncbi:MAG: histidine kinase, partial [Desulfobacterales bacterium]|nr:histidine kinase [Desulfobacterales bacterium]
MSPNLKLEIAAISLVHIVAIVLSVVCLATFYMKTRRDDPSANAFVVMLSAMILWMIFKIFKTVSPDVTLRWIFILGYYACTCVVEAAFLTFGYATATGKPLPKRVRWFAFGLPVIQFSWILTNPLHFHFYSHYDFWGDSFGPLFYLHMLIEYTYFGVGIYFCRKRFKREFSRKTRAVSWLVGIGIITPLVLNFLYITKVINALTIIAGIPVVFDITPIVFTWSTLLFMVATFNHDLFTLSPLMRHEITHHLSLPIALFDHRFRLTYGNRAFEDLFDTPEGMEILLKTLPDHSREADEVSYEESFASATFFIYCKRIKTFTGSQHLVTIRNISLYKKIQKEIGHKKREIQNRNTEIEATIAQLKKLSKESAHTFVARELHDIIGHSLVTAIKLLEVAEIKSQKREPEASLPLTQAVTALSSGLSGIKRIPQSQDSNAPCTGDALKTAIQKTMDEARHTGLQTTLHFQGMIYPLSPQAFTALHRTATELITNCLKHAEATRLFL